MTLDRRYVLGGLFAVLAVATAVLLVDVLSTVFFAITVAYLLVPVRDELVNRGLTSHVACLLATAAAFLGVVAVVAPLVLIIAGRLSLILEVLNSVPSMYTLELFGQQFTYEFADAQTFIAGVVRNGGRMVLSSAPVLLIKLTLFGFLVFSLLLRSQALAQALLALVPPGYRDVAKALNRRARNTLFAIYILQAATSFGTFLIAIPVFFFLGYPPVLTLAVVSAILQFIPILGPSILLFVIAAFHLVANEVVRAVLIVVVGGFFIAWLPDILIRPRLARRTANLSGGVYFVGFVGGILSMGAIGVIAGPLIVALVAEAAHLLSEELNAIPVDEEGGRE